MWTSEHSSWNSLLSCMSHSPGVPAVQSNALGSVVEQPLKIPFLAAIVCIVNPKKPEVTEEVLAKAGSSLQEHLQAGNWREVKLLLRFLGCLQGLLQGDGIFPILGELFDRAVDLQTASSEDVRLHLLD